MKRLLSAFLILLLALPPLALGQQPVAAQGTGSLNTADAAWTSGTSGNTAVTLVSNSFAYSSVLVTLVQGTTLTGGVVTFESSIDNSTWVGVQGVNVTSTTIMGPTYTLAASTNVSFLFSVNAPYFRVRLSTVITGSGTVTVQHATQSFPAVGLLAGVETLGAGSNVIGHVIGDSGSTTAVTQATGSNLHAVLDAGSAVIGKTGIDQTTPGTTNAIELIPDTASAVALSNATKATLTTSSNVKSSAGNVYGVFAINGAASTCWIQFINASGAGTLGTNVIFSIPLPASTTQPIWVGPTTLALANFSTGIAVGIATTATGSSGCGTGGNLTVFYK